MLLGIKIHVLKCDIFSSYTVDSNIEFQSKHLSLSRIVLRFQKYVQIRQLIYRYVFQKNTDFWKPQLIIFLESSHRKKNEYDFPKPCNHTR